MHCDANVGVRLHKLLSFWIFGWLHRRSTSADCARAAWTLNWRRFSGKHFASTRTSTCAAGSSRPPWCVTCLSLLMNHDLPLTATVSFPSGYFLSSYNYSHFFFNFFFIKKNLILNLWIYPSISILKWNIFIKFEVTISIWFAVGWRSGDRHRRGWSDRHQPNNASLVPRQMSPGR